MSRVLVLKVFEPFYVDGVLLIGVSNWGDAVYPGDALEWTDIDGQPGLSSPVSLRVGRIWSFNVQVPELSRGCGGGLELHGTGLDTVRSGSVLRSSPKPVIECTPEIVSGAPRFSGTRVTVYNIVYRLFRGESIQDAIDDILPCHSSDEVIVAVNYCRQRSCIKDAPRRFCSGCSLRGWQEQDSLQEELDSWVTTEDDTPMTLESGKMIFLGSRKQLESQLRGEPGWEQAQVVWERLVKLGVVCDQGADA